MDLTYVLEAVTTDNSMQRFDCLSVCEDGITRTTGQCSGDDEDRTTLGQDDTDTDSPTEPTMIVIRFKSK
jgi:hypothetical protein